MKPRFLFAAVAVACASQSAPLWAQVANSPGFLSDPRISEGLGVKTGVFELHPGVAGEVGYDSNYFIRAGYIANSNPQIEAPIIDAYRLRITPSLSFRTLGERSGDEGGGHAPPMAFSGDLAATYNALFAADSKYSSETSKQDHVAGLARLALDILPDRPWGADISGTYTRTVEASNEPDTANAFRRDTVLAAAGIVWRPGGGLFRWRLGYGLKAQFFEQAGFQDLNNLTHRVDTEVRWKFLPRTAIVYQGDVDWLGYTRTQQALNDNGLSNGAYTNSLIGLNGLVTNYLGVLALGGWGATFFDNRGNVPAENFDSFIAQAEVTWYLNPQADLPEGKSPGLSNISLGYHRSDMPSYLGNYHQRDRGYVDAVMLFGTHFVISLVGGLSHITRPPTYFITGDERFGVAGEENRVDAMAFFEYRPTSSIGINAMFRYDAELTNKPVGIVDVANPLGAPGQSSTANQVDNLEFKRYQIYLGLRWFL